MSEDFYNQIDEELRGFPERSDPPDFYRFAQRIIGRFLRENRNDTIGALRKMLHSGFERDVLIALKSIDNFLIVELAPDLRRLVELIKNGRYLKPSYERQFLHAIDSCHRNQS